jgi:hypothetical protein
VALRSKDAHAVSAPVSNLDECLRISRRCRGRR